MLSQAAIDPHRWWEAQEQLPLAETACFVPTGRFSIPDLLFVAVTPNEFAMLERRETQPRPEGEIIESLHSPNGLSIRCDLATLLIDAGWTRSNAVHESGVEKLPLGWRRSI
jgi:hypothetical protein